MDVARPFSYQPIGRSDRKSERRGNPEVGIRHDLGISHRSARTAARDGELRNKNGEVVTMDCTFCENLKSELACLERIHAEKQVALREIRGHDHRARRMDLNEATFLMETARAKLNRHLRDHQAHLTAP